MDENLSMAAPFIGTPTPPTQLVADTDTSSILILNSIRTRFIEINQKGEVSHGYESNSVRSSSTAARTKKTWPSWAVMMGWQWWTGPHGKE
jgi:hypothetical protein